MRKNLLLSLLGVLLCAFAGTVSAEPQRKPTPMRPSELMCENLVDPVGIDTPFPLLSWKFTTDGAKLKNCAFRLSLPCRTDSQNNPG